MLEGSSRIAWALMLVILAASPSLASDSGSGTISPLLPSVAYQGDAAGRRVATLVDRDEEAGPHAVPFDLGRAGGRRLGPGVYMVRLEAEGEQRSLRVIGLQ